MLETGFTSFSQTAAALTSVAVARGSAGSLRPAGWPPAKQGLARVFRVFWILGFRVLGFGGLGFRVLGFRILGFRVLGFGVQGLSVLGLGFRFCGLEV